MIVATDTRNPTLACITCHVTLRGRIPSPGYPDVPLTVGEHLRRARLDRGLRLCRAASAIDYSVASLASWETGSAAPTARFWPAILAFRGYNPRPEAEGLGGQIRAEREAAGLSKREPWPPAGTRPLDGIRLGAEGSTPPFVAHPAGLRAVARAAREALSDRPSFGVDESGRVSRGQSSILKIRRRPSRRISASVRRSA
jgi:hypothetical protein